MIRDWLSSFMGFNLIASPLPAIAASPRFVIHTFLLVWLVGSFSASPPFQWPISLLHSSRVTAVIMRRWWRGCHVRHYMQWLVVSFPIVRRFFYRDCHYVIDKT